MANSTFTHREAPASHFSKKIQRALLKQGIVLTGLTTIPGIDPFTGKASYLYNTQTGYCLNDNDTGRVVSYADVMRIGGEPVRWA